MLPKNKKKKHAHGSFVILTSLSIVWPFGISHATMNPSGFTVAAARMASFKLINGVDITGDLALNENMTREQLVTVLVRAFGQEANAKYLNGAAAFPDTANHPWASGYIAMAKKLVADRTGGKEVIGLPDGTFNPDGNVTAAEAVAFLMKFLGAPKDETLSWPMNYIQGALNAGLITTEDKAVLEAIINAPVTRGLAFYLCDRTFYGYKLAESGKTVYTTYEDDNAPQLTVDIVPATTTNLKITISGTASGDVVAVHVGSMDNSATIQNGKFTATIDLQPNHENNIRILAVDLAGNTTEQTIKVTHYNPDPTPTPIPPVITPTKIETSSTTMVNLLVGQSKTITFTVYDQNGKPFTGAKVNFNVTGSLKQLGLSALTGQTDADGKVAITFTGDESFSNGTITASVQGTHMQVQTGTINILGEPALIIASPEHSEITTLLPAQSITATFTVMDQTEKPISGVVLDLSLTENLLLGDLSATTITTNENGIATVTYTNNHPNRSGTIRATIKGKPDISDSTGPIDAYPDIPAKIDASSTTMVNLLVGQSKTITFTVYDQNGKPFNRADVKFNVTGSLKQLGLSALTEQTDADGKVAITFTGDESGDNGTITASVDGTNVHVQTGTINIVEPARIIASPDDTWNNRGIFPGASITATFTVLDRNEKPISGLVLDLTLTNSLLLADLSATTITTNENGIATVTYTNNHPNRSGTIQASIKGISASTGTIYTAVGI